MRKPRPGEHRRAGKEHPGGCGAETGTPGPLCSHRLSRSPERQPWVLPLSSSAQRCGSRACCGHLTTEQPTLTLTSPTGLEGKGSVSPPTTQSRVQARSRQRHRDPAPAPPGSWTLQGASVSQDPQPTPENTSQGWPGWKSGGLPGLPLLSTPALTGRLPTGS